MKHILLFALLLLSYNSFSYQRVNGLYVDTFGDKKKQPLIFIHGGPGYNSYYFQSTTADTLSKNGYYVIVYDQRGQGRNESGEQSEFTYDKYADDLKEIIDQLDIKKPVLLAHSHGGFISIKFDKKYPNIAKSIVLIGAPLDFWTTIESMKSRCLNVYQSNNQTEKVEEIKSIFSSLQGYLVPSQQHALNLSRLFAHGLEGCGLYRPSKTTKLINPNSQKEFIEKDKRERPNGHLGPFADQRKPLPGFLFNENYIKINELEYVGKQKNRYWGIYGSDDGLFQSKDLSIIENVVGKNRFSIIKGASHNIYSERQNDFIDTLNSFLKSK